MNRRIIAGLLACGMLALVGCSAPQETATPSTTVTAATADATQTAEPTETRTLESAEIAARWDEDDFDDMDKNEAAKILAGFEERDLNAPKQLEQLTYAVNENWNEIVTSKDNATIRSYGLVDNGASVLLLVGYFDVISDTLSSDLDDNVKQGLLDNSVSEFAKKSGVDSIQRVSNSNMRYAWAGNGIRNDAPVSVSLWSNDGLRVYLLGLEVQPGASGAVASSVLLPVAQSLAMDGTPVFNLE